VLEVDATRATIGPWQLRLMGGCHFLIGMFKFKFDRLN
jgi:hypothetical protein